MFQKALVLGFLMWQTSVVAQNLGFELSTPGQYTATNGVNEWTLTSAYVTTSNCTSLVTYSPGASRFWLQATPVLSVQGLGTLPPSPLGGSVVAQLGSYIGPYSTVTRISTSIAVTTTNNILHVAIAGLSQNSGHYCCETPCFKIELFSLTGGPLPCSSFSVSPVTPQCTFGQTGFSTTPMYGDFYTSWKTYSVDLSPYVGLNLRLDLLNLDCVYGGHYAMSFFDVATSQQYINPNLIPIPGTMPGPISYCSGSGSLQINAPLGYVAYNWLVAPGTGTVTSPSTTLPWINIANPQPWATYTCQFMTQSGCAFTSTYSPVPSTVSIVATGQYSSCSQVANGSATIQSAGSGSGYTYTWTGTTGSFVTTNSVVGNLPPGSYTVIAGALGSPSCGTDTTLIQIQLNPSASPPISVNASNSLICNGAQVQLWATGGNSYTWTNGPSTSVYTFSPTTSGIYTVTASNLNFHCPATRTIEVDVFSPTANAWANPPQVCSGNSLVLGATGANSYTWSTGVSGASIGVTPSASTVYTLTATSYSSGLGCNSQTTIAVQVLPTSNPVILVSNPVICLGDSVNLQVTGVGSYTWSNGTVNSPLHFIASTSTIHHYTVTGVNTFGCTGQAGISLETSACLGLNENSTACPFKVFPNPSQGEFRISADREMDIRVFSSNGSLIGIFHLYPQNQYSFVVTQLAEGAYAVEGEGSILRIVVIH